MEFPINVNSHPNKKFYSDQQIDMTIQFTKSALSELNEFIKAIIVYGSKGRYTVSQLADDSFLFDHDEDSDIDVAIIVDDVRYKVNAEFVNTYRLVMANILRKHKFKIHLQTIKLSTYWDYARVGHPILINILRTGYPIYDTSLFEPMQYLLDEGKIKGTPESVNMFYQKSLAAFHSTKLMMMKAVVDLYWCCYDSAQAALMKVGELPGLPQLVGDLLQVRFVQTGRLDEKHVEFFKHMYDIAKRMEKNPTEYITGSELEVMQNKTQEFHEEMKKLIYFNEQ